MDIELKIIIGRRMGCIGYTLPEITTLTLILLPFLHGNSSKKPDYWQGRHVNLGEGDNAI